MFLAMCVVTYSLGHVFFFFRWTQKYWIISFKCWSQASSYFGNNLHYNVFLLFFHSFYIHSKLCVFSTRSILRHWWSNWGCFFGEWFWSTTSSGFSTFLTVNVFWRLWEDFETIIWRTVLNFISNVCIFFPR